MGTPTMTIDGVEYVEAPETYGCNGCEFFLKRASKCHRAISAGAKAFGKRCGESRVIYIKARSES